uniref:E3 ubiquitin-protein ligase RNF182 n=1 Tax=Centroberyx gerrardi TaxID=166262 RepID=UPI003AACD5CA
MIHSPSKSAVCSIRLNIREDLIRHLLLGSDVMPFWLMNSDLVGSQPPLVWRLRLWTLNRTDEELVGSGRSWKEERREHELKMSCLQAELEEKACPPPEELECKICYQRYNAHNRKPKILDCLHRVCARCLNKILDMADAAGCISCPFCRHQTEVTEYEVSCLPDDANIMSRLATRDKSWSSDHSKEVVLTPKSLSSSSPSHDSSNCLVITIMEVQRDLQRSPSRNGSSDIYAEQSLDSVSLGSNRPADQDALSKFCNHVPRILVWLLGFFYFGSLPLGIYLLVIQRVTLGIVCVSLVPSSLTVCLVYGFCQCLCQGMCDCSSRG